MSDSIIFFIIILFIFLSVVYFFLYQFLINRRLKTGKKGKSIPTPRVGIVISVILIMILVPILLSGNKTYPNAATIADCDVFRSDTIPETYATVYKKGEDISGYNRYELVDGNFLYTYYMSITEFDVLHPKFIIFVEYIGENENDIYKISSGFSYVDGGCAYTSSGEAKANDYYCIVGNANGECGYKVFAAAYSAERAEKMMEEYEGIETLLQNADSSSRFSIELDKDGDIKY